MSKAPYSRLEHLHFVLTEELIRLVESGEADASTLSAAAKFLKDNGIDARTKDGAELEERLRRLLPFESIEAA